MILTNKLNLPQPFVDAATNDHKYTEGRYSVTAHAADYARGGLS